MYEQQYYWEGDDYGSSSTGSGASILSIIIGVFLAAFLLGYYGNTIRLHIQEKVTPQLIQKLTANRKHTANLLR